jgi:hypothetical protein
MKQLTSEAWNAPDELERVEIDVGADLRGQVGNFSLVAKENGLFLFGHAKSYYAKQRAQHLVMQRSHLQIAANHITVAGNTESGGARPR